MLWRMQADVDVDELSRQVDLDKIGWTEFATAGTIIIVTFVVARVVRSLLARALKRGQADDFISELIGRVASYLLLVFGLIYALEALGIAIGPALGALGIVGIALAFALQDLLENFVAGVLLQLRRPFRPGDEVQSVDHEGAIVRNRLAGGGDPHARRRDRSHSVGGRDQAPDHQPDRPQGPQDHRRGGSRLRFESCGDHTLAQRCRGRGAGRLRLTGPAGVQHGIRRVFDRLRRSLLARADHCLDVASPP
ncbi:MAG: mechanosensitive ion channel [Acidimicrobiales bacterium]